MSLRIDDSHDGVDAQTLGALPNQAGDTDLFVPLGPGYVGPSASRVGNLSASSAPEGISLPIEDVEEGRTLGAPAEDAFEVDVAALPREPKQRQPLLYVKPNGHLGLNRAPDLDEDFTPAAREIYKNDWLGMIRFISQGDEEQRAERERFILRDMSIAREAAGADIPNFENEINILAAKSGMSEEEYRHWQERDPKYIANQITDREIYRLSGPDGYTTGLARNPDQREMARADAVLYAQAEADNLAQRGDFFAHARYEFASGVGQVGVFAVRGMAAAARLGSDVANSDIWNDQSALIARDQWRHAAEWWNEYAKDAEAKWTGPAIDTGNATFDFIRSAIFQGTPMLGAFVALSAIPGVGTAGSSAIMGSLMGGDTYLTLRNDGISPLLAASAAVPVGLVSYATNKFTLDNLTRFLGGRSPLGMFSAGTLLEVAEEAGQEVIENTTQATAEGLARIIGDSEYTSRKFWSDWKEGFLGSITEGGMAGISTAAMRLIGLPLAARNQMRANAFANNFTKTGATLAKTEAFAKAPDVLAASMNGMAKHHNAGPVFTSVEQLEQAGVTREQATAPVKDGGLGVDEKAYDNAAVTGGDIGVGYGNALVFSQKQKEAGNAKAEGAFSVSPDAMSVGDIRAQRLAAEEHIDQAETYFQQLQQNNEEGTPLRLRVFRAGLRTVGYDANQADALTAMYRAGAERHAEQWGTTVEEWLDQQNVQLMMDQALLASGRREATHYLKLLKELSERDNAPAEAESSAPAAVESEAAEAAAADEPALSAAQSDVDGIPLEPADTAEDRAAWENEAVKTASAELADAAGIPEAERGPLVEAVRQVAEAAAPIIESALPQADVAAAPPPATTGRETEIIFPAETGTPPLAAHYELVEADSLQPSHSPGAFTPNPAWPAEFIAQQRNYDSPAMEATRQGIQLSRLDFGALFNPTTDAVNGPPVVMPDGMVLGGNNRTLRILNRYDQDNYKMLLTAQLAARSNATGIPPEAAEAMNRPVLVRVAEKVAREDIPSLIGALNADFTTRRDAGNLAANRGMRVGTRTLRSFAGIGDQTVSAFLDNPQKAFGVVQALLADGVFQETDLPMLFDMANGKWLPGGKAQVEQALFGAVLPDSRLLDEMTPAMQRKLLKALPALVRLKTAGSPELADLFQAIRWHNEYRDFRATALGKQFKTEPARLEAFRRPDMANMFTGEMEAEKGGAAWDMLLDIQKAKSQKEVAEYFTRKADEISGAGRGLFSLHQESVNEKRAKFDALPMLETDSKSIKEIPTGEGFAERLVTWAEKSGIYGTYANTDTGWNDVIVNEQSIRDVNYHHARAGKLALMQIVEELIRDGVYLETGKRDDRGAVSHVFAGKAKIDGVEYVVGFSINEDANGRRYYNHELTTIEKALADFGVGDGKPSAIHRAKREPINSIVRRHLNVKPDTPIIETLYQPAYHGSLHRFDRFSLDAIGSGEGAQMYGWGLYFAGDKEVSEWYRKRLTHSKTGMYTINGVEAKNWMPLDREPSPVVQGLIAKAIASGELDDKKALQYTIDRGIENLNKHAEPARIERNKKKSEFFTNISNEKPLRPVSEIDAKKLYEIYREDESPDFKYLEYISETYYPSLIFSLINYKGADEDFQRAQSVFKNSIEELNELKNAEVIYQRRKGQLFKVEIPENDVLLDWDKPLSEQSNFIVEALKKRKYDFEGEVKTGAELYWQIEKYWDGGESNSAEMASRTLNAIGIKGIRYLDGNSRRAGEGNYNYVIFDDSAIDILETYYQGEGELNSPRGSISFTPAATIINIFKGADVSTVVHELNHLFLNDLIKMVRAGRGGETASGHLDVLNAFTEGKLLSENPDERRDAFEKIASAWERYAMEGVAPSTALEDPFAIFRKYITLAYRGTLESLEEPSPEVRRVFDAFLATDEEIEAAARRREFNDQWEKLGKSSGSVVRKMDVINRRRDDRKRKRADAAKGGGRQMRRESALDATRRLVKGEMAEEPVYRAVDIAKAKGGINRAVAVAAVGEAAVKKIEEVHGAGVFSEKYDGGIAMGEVAARAGYPVDAVADMLGDIAEAESLADKADSEARKRQGAYDAFEDLEFAEQEETEGVDEEADEPVEPGEEADPFSRGDMTGEQEFDADTEDMKEEVAAAIEDEVTDGGKDESLGRKRELQRRLNDYRDRQAVLYKQAWNEMLAKDMRVATDLQAYRKDRKRAHDNAYNALDRGDRAGFTHWKMRELRHHYQIVAARKARKLRERYLEKYGPGALRKAMDAAEHEGNMEYEFAKSLARTALYAGCADSRFLKQRAGEDAGKSLAIPKEDPDLGGLVMDIEDTLPDWLLNMERPEGFKDFRDFSVGQLYEIDRLMRWLIDNGRGKLNAIADREAANLVELVGKSTAPMARRDNLESTGGKDARKLWNKTLNGINRFLISLTLPENWFMAMDGNPTIRGGEMGINQRLFRMMVNADVKRDLLYSRMMGELEPHFTVLRGERERWEKAVGGKFAAITGLAMPEIMKRGRDITTWDFDLLLSVAAQMGNDANLRRLLTDAEFDARFGTKVTPEGGQDMSAPRYNFTNAQLAIVARQFSADGWRAIQGILDGVNTLYGDADAVTFNLTNRHVTKEKPTAHTVHTSDGEVLSLKGGYFPLVNDPMLATRSGQLNEKSDIEEQIRTGLLNNVHGAARREVGAIKGRARNEEGVPMVTLPQILSSSIIVRHIDTMAHYITHAEILRDLDRMTRHEGWRSEYVNKFGQEQYQAVRRWLKNLAAPERGSGSPGEMFMERMRNLATVNALGFRWKTGLKQRQGAFQAANYMTDASMTKSSGWKWMAVGVAELGFSGNVGFANDKVAFVNDKSDFMRARSGGFDREVRAMRDKLSPLHKEYFGKSPGEWQNFAFAWIQANDQAMASAVWLGAYRQALAGEANIDIKKLHKEGVEAGRSEAEINSDIDRLAVEFADVAAATQASSFAADLTEIQRDRGFMRFLSMFMSGNVRQGSRILQYLDARKMGDKTTGDVAWLAVREFVFPSLAWVFTAAAVKYAAAAALGIGDDDDDNLLTEALWETLDTATAPFPLLRDVPSTFRQGFMSGDVPAVRGPARALSNVAGVPGRLANAQYMRAVGQVMDAAGFVFGIPVMNPLNDLGIAEFIGLKAEKK